MKIISGDRQSGKTNAALQYAIEHNCVLVVRSCREAERVARIAYDMGHKVDVISFLTLQRVRYSTGMRGYRYVIDDIDMFFDGMYMPDTIEAVSVYERGAKLNEYSIKNGLFWILNKVGFFKKQGERNADLHG